MTETKISLPLRGGWAVLGLLGLLLMMGYRISNLSGVRDPALLAIVQRELQNEKGNELSRKLQSTGKGQDLQALAQMVSDKVAIHSVHVSKPLWSFSSKTKAVLKVEYSLPGNSARHVKYYKAMDSLLTGWQIFHESTVVAYYLNFL